MKPLAALLLTLCASFTQAQTGDESWSVPGQFNLFTTDELGNLFTLQGNDIDLYGPDGKRLAHNSLNSFGPISRIDAFSSLKPLIFSRDQGQLALLDNTLSMQGSPLVLSRNGFPQVTLACMSVRNSFWFFDERDLALLRVDAQLKVLANTGRLDQLLGFSPKPVYMTEEDGRLYLADPVHGVLVFDLFGTYLRTLPVTGARTVQVRDGALWAVSGGKLLHYDPLLFTTDTVPWPATTDTLNVRGARIAHGRMYRLFPDRIQADRLAP